MAIIRGGDAEYAENQPSLEEKSEKLAQSVDAALKQDSSTLKLNGQYLSTDEIIIISGFESIQSVRSLDLSDNQIGEPALKVLFQSPMLKDLQELYLGINFLTDAGILEISRFPITLRNKMKPVFEKRGENGRRQIPHRDGGHFQISKPGVVSTPSCRTRVFRLVSVLVS